MWRQANPPDVQAGREPSLRIAGWCDPGTTIVVLVIALAAGVIVGSPVFGWFPVVRVSIVMWAILLAGMCAARPWRWRSDQWSRVASWSPTAGSVTWGFLLLGIVLWWLVYSRFQAGGIDAVDFTVYFDRPLYQTSVGRPLWVESTDDPRFEHLTHLAVHGYWILPPLSLLYRIHPSPMWLLAVSAAAVTAGAFYVFRIVESLDSPALGVAAAIGFVFNSNTARALNYGFHPEILYAWFVPWAIQAGLRRRPLSFSLAILGCVMVKEDAIFPLMGVSVALALTSGRAMNPRRRLMYLITPPALALINLSLFYGWVVPKLAPESTVMYSYFWETSGATPYEALVGLLSHPGRLLTGALTSGFFTLVLASHWYLPLLGWRWIIGLLPLVLVYGASDNDQIRRFGIYYGVPLVPFLSIGAAAGARTITRWLPQRAVGTCLAGVLVIASALSYGLGYSLRPWKYELRAVPEALARLQDRHTVLVQGGLYPHAGYADRVQLLTEHALRGVENDQAVMLLATRGSAYPLKKEQWRCLIALPSVAAMPDRLLATEVSTEARRCLDSRRSARVSRPRSAETQDPRR